MSSTGAGRGDTVAPDTIGVCVKPLHFSYNKSLELLQFIELNRILASLQERDLGPALAWVQANRHTVTHTLAHGLTRILKRSFGRRAILLNCDILCPLYPTAGRVCVTGFPGKR